MPHLPGAIHFVAQAPQLDVQRILRAICDTHVTELASSWMVGVLDNVSCILRSSGSKVDRVHDLCVCLFRPVRKFVQANRIGFGGKPRQIQPARAVAPHAVLPVETGNEVASGITDHGDPQLSHHLQHIPAEALRIRHRMTGLINAAIHRTSKMLNERAVNARVNPSNDIVLIQYDLGVFHPVPLSSLCFLLYLFCNDQIDFSVSISPVRQQERLKRTSSQSEILWKSHRILEIAYKSNHLFQGKGRESSKIKETYTISSRI